LKSLGNYIKFSKCRYFKLSDRIKKIIFTSIIFISLIYNCYGQIKSYNTFGNNLKNNYIEYAIPVGLLDFDEELRDLQLLNIYKYNNSFNIRPIYTNYKFSYDSILNNIDTGIDFNVFTRNLKKVNYNLIPLSLQQKYTSDHPFGWSDGVFKNAKGYQSILSSGVNINYKNLLINIAPEYLYTENKNNPAFQNLPKVYKTYLGNSFVYLNIKNIIFGVSNQNLWWGPGVFNSLLMSNNAPGFMHFNISTVTPIKTFIGSFEFQLIGGKLTRDLSQGLETLSMNKPDSLNLYFPYIKDYSQFNDRYFNGISISFNPKFFKHFHLGIERAFQNYTRESIPNNFIQNYLPIFSLFTRNDYEDQINRDQYIAINGRWLFPKDHAEIYFESGFNDAFQNLRDFSLDLEHATAYIFGFKKLDLLSYRKYITYNLEFTRLSQTPSYLHRQAGNWYKNAQILEGYTNDNQIMGTGGGLGNNIQTLSVGYINNDFKIKLKLQHIAQDPNGIYDSGNGNNGLNEIKWNDYLIGYNIQKRYNKFMFKHSVDFIKSKNYNWVNNLDKNNFVINLSSIYLW